MAKADRMRRETPLTWREAQVYVLRQEPYDLSHSEVATVLPIARSTSGEYTRRARRRLADEEE
jgi:hypothetical protein